MKYLIKELDEENRPRERLKKYGASALSDDELLAIVIRTGSRELNAKDLAMKVLLKIDGVNNFNNSSLNDLAGIKGVGEVKAITILAAIELGKRTLKHNNLKIKINNNRVVYDLFKYDFINVYQEKFLAIFLDIKKNLITSEVIFVGTVSEAKIHPREIFKSAIKNSASAIIVVHNHPTGDSNPSQADEELTNKLMAAGKLLNIPILDHIIIGFNNYYSFLDRKRFDYNE